MGGAFLRASAKVMPVLVVVKIVVVAIGILGSVGPGHSRLINQRCATD
jgi:hypothetical protein